MRQIDYIRFCIRKISGENADGNPDYRLYISSITAHSDKFDSAELKNRISEARAKARNTVLTNSSLLGAEPKINLMIPILSIIIIGVALVGFYDRKQK